MIAVPRVKVIAARRVAIVLLQVIGTVIAAGCMAIAAFVGLGVAAGFAATGFAALVIDFKIGVTVARMREHAR